MASRKVEHSRSSPQANTPDGPRYVGGPTRTSTPARGAPKPIYGESVKSAQAPVESKAVRVHTPRSRPEPRPSNFTGSSREPSREASLPKSAITIRNENPVRQGHPWIFREQILSGLDDRSDGDLALVYRRPRQGVAEPDADRFLGLAVLEPNSAIAARMLTTLQKEPGLELKATGALGLPTSLHDPRVAPWMELRLKRALQLRAPIREAKTTAYRWVHGEGDRLPGIVLDVYGHVAVLRLDGQIWSSHLAWWTERIVNCLPPEVTTLVLRGSGRGKDGKEQDERIRHLHGELCPDVIEVAEHGVLFEVDLARGQKTGAFLDQRENRARVQTMAAGKKVLNLFSYAGGFSLRAVLGGATQVTSVDVAAAAHGTAQRSFQKHGLDASEHRWVSADVFSFLERAKSEQRKWDLIISDPPNMAPSEATKPKAIQTYRRLHALAVSVLADGGLFCAASCSSHLNTEEFLSTLDDQALNRTDMRVLESFGAGADHPSLPAFPEGRYLKFCVLG